MSHVEWQPCTWQASGVLSDTDETLWEKGYLLISGAITRALELRYVSGNLGNYKNFGKISLKATRPAVAPVLT